MASYRTDPGETRTLLLSGSHSSAGAYFAGVMHGVLLAAPHQTRWSHVSGTDAGSLPAALLATQSVGSEDPIEIFHATRSLNNKLSSGKMFCGIRWPKSMTMRSNMRAASQVLSSFLVDDRITQSGRVVCTGLLDNSTMVYQPSYALRYHTATQDINADFSRAVLESTIGIPIMGSAKIGSSQFLPVNNSGMLVAPVPLNVHASRETQFMAPTQTCDIITTHPRGVRNLYHSVAYARQLENTFTAVKARGGAYSGSLYQLGSRFGIQFRLFAPRRTLPCTNMVYGQLSEEDLQNLFEIGRQVASRTVHSNNRGMILDEYAPPVAEGLVMDMPEAPSNDVHVTVPQAVVAASTLPSASQFLTRITLDAGQRAVSGARRTAMNRTH